MDLETTQTTTTAKLPILKQGEYDMWRLRIEQYFQVQDYALWDVIENGNSFKLVAQTTTNADGTSTSLIPGPVTTKEKAQKKNDVKVLMKLILFMELVLLTLKLALLALKLADNKTRFGGLQKIVGHVGILGENISQEDLNLKFLRSLPSEWNTHVVVWRNKLDLDTMSFDDLYNNFKIVEQEVKGTASSSSSSISTANTQVSPTSTQVNTASTQDLKQIHEDDIEEMDLKWQLALLSMRTSRFLQKTSRKITINRSDTAGYDKSKVECFNCHKIGHFTKEYKGPRNQDNRNMNQDSSRRTVNVEETSSKSMVAIDGASFDWSYMADDEVPTNILFSPPKFDLSNSGQEEFQQPEFEGYRPKTSKSVSEDISNEVKESLNAPLVKEWVLADESQVLLKVPRKNNMYSVDMKNIIPKECLTCLLAKATLDESMLWHRWLGKATESLLCDNGTEFKNKVMSEFCEQKGIKKEYSIAMLGLKRLFGFLEVTAAQENSITVTKMSTPATAEEKTNKKNDVKARGLLLMALPNVHQLTFSQYPDAKSMFAAIETRFGGNVATKKTQKTLLKQQYENFSATS
ncbi:ribonuclease H-like domain-containing protein, partial [Tanacetum coccineum]